MSNHRKFSAEFKAEVVKLVISSSRSVIQVSADIGVNEATLGNWARAWRQEHPEVEVDERGPVEWAGYKVLQAENVELKLEIDFLGKVSAFFAAKQQQGGEEKTCFGLEKNFITFHNYRRKCQASTEEKVSRIRRSPTNPLELGAKISYP